MARTLRIGLSIVPDEPFWVHSERTHFCIYGKRLAPAEMANGDRSDQRAHA